MKIIPQSIFGRTVLLFSIMMLLNYFSSIIVYFVFFTKPFAEITAYNFSQKAEMIHSALNRMPASQRNHYLDDLISSDVITQHKSKVKPPGYSAENIYQKIVNDEIIQRLSPQVKDIKFQMKED